MMAEFLPRLIGIRQLWAFYFKDQAGFRGHMKAYFPLWELAEANFTAKKGLPSIPFVFAVHPWNLACLEVQGNRGMKRCQVTAKCMLQKAEQQAATVLKERRDLFGGKKTQLQHFLSVMGMINQKPKVIHQYGLHYDTGLYFDPWTAGQFSLFLKYFVSLFIGSIYLDDKSQLRLLLHIYNALRVIGVMSEQIGLLDELMELVEGGPVVFVGGRPSSAGSFYKGFMLDFGSSAEYAKGLSSSLRATYSPSVDNVWEAKAQAMKGSKTRKGKQHRNQVPLEPEQLSTAYEPIALGSFAAFLSKSKKCQNSNDISHAELLDIARGLAVRDKGVCMNLMSLGTCLMECVLRLTVDCGMEPALQKAKDTINREVISGAKGRTLKEELQHNMDYAITYQVSSTLLIMCDNHVPGTTPAPELINAKATLIDFFRNLDPKRYTIGDNL